MKEAEHKPAKVGEPEAGRYGGKAESKRKLIISRRQSARSPHLREQDVLISPAFILVMYKQAEMAFEHHCQEDIALSRTLGFSIYPV